MLIDLILTLIITLMIIIFTILTPLFPVINTAEIYPIIDNFMEIVEVGLDGVHFILGDLPFILAPVIMSLYLFYYTVFIPIRFIIKTFFK